MSKVNGCRLKPYFENTQQENDQNDAKIMSIRCQTFTGEESKKGQKGKSSEKQPLSRSERKWERKKRKKKRNNHDGKQAQATFHNGKDNKDARPCNHNKALNGIEKRTSMQTKEETRSSETHIKRATSRERDERTTKQSTETTEEGSTESEMSKAKAPAIQKGMYPISLPVIPDLRKQENEDWSRKLGFKALIQQDWERLVEPEGAEELIKHFLETDTVVTPGRLPVPVNTVLVKQVLGLHDEGNCWPWER